MEHWSSERTPTARPSTIPRFGLDDAHGIAPKLTSARGAGGVMRFGQRELAS